MKYAFMTFSTPALNLDDVLATAKQYGYDGIEPRLDAGHKHGVEVAASATCTFTTAPTATAPMGSRRWGPARSITNESLSYWPPRSSMAFSAASGSTGSRRRRICPERSPC